MNRIELAIEGTNLSWQDVKRILYCYVLWPEKRLEYTSPYPFGDRLVVIIWRRKDDGERRKIVSCGRFYYLSFFSGDPKPGYQWVGCIEV